MFSEKEFKDFLFEVFAAGFEAGYGNDVDIASAFKKYYEGVMQPIIQEVKRQQ